MSKGQKETMVQCDDHILMEYRMFACEQMLTSMQKDVNHIKWLFVLLIAQSGTIGIGVLL